MLILALGRLGGRALTHASDLDIIYVYDAPAGAMSDGAKPLSATDYYNRLANRVTAAISVPTAAGPLYDVDTRLRPQGGEGMLAVPLEGSSTTSAARPGPGSIWPCAAPGRSTARRQARADPEAIRSILSAPRDPGKTRADAAKMRDDMARHKKPSGPLDIKLGPGGLVDLEFAVHTLQLITARGSIRASNMRSRACAEPA